MDKALEPLGLGLDCIELHRVEKAYRNFGPRWLCRLLSQREQKAFASSLRPLEYLGGRLAAKEAALKALSSNFIKLGPCFNQIEILNQPDGQPALHVLKDLRKRLTALSLSREVWQVSISHTKNLASACVMWWGINSKPVDQYPPRCELSGQAAPQSNDPNP